MTDRKRKSNNRRSASNLSTPLLWMYL